MLFFEIESKEFWKLKTENSEAEFLSGLVHTHLDLVAELPLYFAKCFFVGLSPFLNQIFTWGVILFGNLGQVFLVYLFNNVEVPSTDSFLMDFVLS